VPFVNVSSFSDSLIYVAFLDVFVSAFRRLSYWSVLLEYMVLVDVWSLHLLYPDVIFQC
jgi:hypothetical protein